MGKYSDRVFTQAVRHLKLCIYLHFSKDNYFPSPWHSTQQHQASSRKLTVITQDSNLYTQMKFWIMMKQSVATICHQPAPTRSMTARENHTSARQGKGNRPHYRSQILVIQVSAYHAVCIISITRFKYTTQNTTYPKLTPHDLDPDLERMKKRDSDLLTSYSFNML